MVKSKKERKSESKALAIRHPNSRKAQRLAKQVIREASRTKSKMSHTIKRNVVGEKLLWFQSNLDPAILVYTPKLFDELLQRYIARNDEELEQIKLKHSIGQRKNRQHASREDVITFTKERELDEYNGPGIEMVDILVPKNLEAFRKWDGNFGRLGLIKLGRFSKTSLEKYKTLIPSKDLLKKQEELQMEKLSSRRGSLCEQDEGDGDKMEEDSDDDSEPQNSC